MTKRYAAYWLAVRDDFCLEESIRSMIQQGVQDAIIISPTTYWSNGKSQSAEDFNELRRIAAVTGARLVSIAESDLVVAPAEENYKALAVEAAYRNAALDVLRESDVVLTVDADEYWPHGVLEHVDSIVGSYAGGGSVRVSLPMVPVIGVPGIPVRGATDKALVATFNGSRFTWGRSTDGMELTGSAPIYHFSATRRTLEELVAKCRESAHYADPTYAFDFWLENTLPNIAVGSVDVHMYQSTPNIWPLAGAWEESELNIIPKSLHQWLLT